MASLFAYTGYRLDKCTIWLEERVMMEAKRKIDLNKVRNRWRHILRSHSTRHGRLRDAAHAGSRHIHLTLTRPDILRSTAERRSRHHQARRPRRQLET